MTARRRLAAALTATACLAGLAAIPSTPAGAAEPWSSAGSIVAGRSAAIAVRLANGTVLVAGGYTEGATRVTLSSAEIYHPGTNTFTNTAPLPAPRAKAAAIVLRTGKVLVACGNDGTALSPTAAYLYDPLARTFSPTGAMAVPRAGASATLLADGRVLIAGGVQGATGAASVEVYDPRTGLFTGAGRMSIARSDQFAVLLRSGKVLVGGGKNFAGTVVSSAELYAGPQTPVTLGSKPAATTTAQSATFKFTSPSFKPTFQCKLDTGSFVACMSGKKFTGLAKGTHTFRVRAISLGVVGLPVSYSSKVV